MSSDPPEARPAGAWHGGDLTPPPMFGSAPPPVSAPPPPPVAPFQASATVPARPPRPRRARRWPATAGVALTALVIAASTLAMTRDTAPAPRHAAAALLGADGHVELLAQGTDRLTTLETADLPGVRALRAGPQSFLSTGYTADETNGRHWLRLSRVNRGPSGYLDRADTLYALDATGLVGHVNDNGDRYVSFRPGLLELPADVHAGSTWQSSGTMFSGKNISVDGSVPYAYAASAQPASSFPGCLTVIGRLTLGTQAIDSSTTWCPGRGIVAETDSDGSRVAVDAFPAWADPRATAATTGEAPARSLAAASLVTVPSVTLPLTPEPASPPTFGLRAGVVASRTSPDVIGFRVAPTGITRAWRAAPGGIAFVQGTFGDVTVVGTTAGRLVAFDADGQRLWQADTTEVPIRHPFVRLDQTTMVATFVDGRVAAYDLRTGAVRWENHVQADLQLPPVVADGRVIVVTPGRDVIAYDAGSGAVQWRTEVPDAAETLAAGNGEVFVSAQVQGRIYALDGSTGDLRWEWIDHEDRLQLIPAGGRLIVIGETSVYALDASGNRQVWRVPITGRAALAGDQLVLVGDTDVTALALDGRQVGHWPLPNRPRRPESTWVSVAADGSVMISDSFFNLYRLAAA